MIVPSPTILSQTQREVLMRIAQGISRKEIAMERGISKKTVEYHCARFQEKLGLYSESELTHYALSCQLIKPLFTLKLPENDAAEFPVTQVIRTYELERYLGPKPKEKIKVEKLPAILGKWRTRIRVAQVGDKYLAEHSMGDGQVRD